MRITPTQLKIAQLFSSKNEQFLIPAYQRRYAWGKKQLLELFEDINQLNQNDTHLLGTILFLTGSHTADMNVLELVDGQQRITSLSLFFKAIQDKFTELKKEDPAKEINTYLFCQGINRKPQHKILLGDLDKPDYSKILVLENSEEIQNKYLLNAYQYFKKRISDYDFEKVNTLYFKLVNNTMVIRLDIGEAKDAYKLFETINNRGLKLSATDIIKNFLLGHASMIDEDVLRKTKEYWKQLIVNLDNIRIDDFFRHYMAGILQRKITFAKLIEEFKKYYYRYIEKANMLPEYRSFSEFEENDTEDEGRGTEEDESEESVLVDSESEEHEEESESEKAGTEVTEKISIVEFAKSLKDSSKIYANIVNNNFDNKKFNRPIYDLQRINSVPSYTFLLNLFHRKIDDQDKIKVLGLIETFMMRKHICEDRTAELDDIFPKLVTVEDENIANHVKKQLAKYLPSDEKFQSKFAEHNFRKNIERAKYALEQFEYYLIEDKGEYILNSGRDVHLEHIIPQNFNKKKAIKECGDWPTYLGDGALTQHTEFVDRIGNYTLLAQELNIKASNNPFQAKKKEYKKSNIQMTKDIYNKNGMFKFRQVKKRSEEFARLAAKIWAF
ncbi:DUF262 domain-containing protein [bacterium]|nr:DUF262 domain-containing protein [bacterium]